MRVMIDTNVLISALLFPDSRTSQTLSHIGQHHTLVLCSFVVEELKAEVVRKFPLRVIDVDRLLSEMSYELVYTPDTLEPGLVRIRDPDDYPVLASAILHGVDVLVTGDKDFGAVVLDAPEILTPAQYGERYGV